MSLKKILMVLSLMCFLVVTNVYAWQNYPRGYGDTNQQWSYYGNTQDGQGIYVQPTANGGYHVQTGGGEENGGMEWIIGSGLAGLFGLIAKLKS